MSVRCSQTHSKNYPEMRKVKGGDKVKTVRQVRSMHHNYHHTGRIRDGQYKTAKRMPDVQLIWNLYQCNPQQGMAKNRSRYWKITSEEMTNYAYDETKLLNWEIKCIREPEEGAHFIGVFMYRHGTAYDYESIHGICYYYNNIDRKELPAITSFLQGRFNGKDMEKGDRIILKDSKEIFSALDISELAKEMEKKFDTRAVISLEFEHLSAEELKSAGLPGAKLLPIPT